MCCNSNTGKVSAQDSPEWLTLSKEAQKRIVNDYVDALDEFAQMMPKFGQDTEAQWAADTVHTMAIALRHDQYPFHKSIATISQMQNYAAYGMTYFNATIGTYKEPTLARYALNIITQSDSLYKSLKEVDFLDVRKLALFNATSVYNMQLFNTLNRINNDRDYNREIFLSIYSIAALDSISQIKEYSDKEIYKISSVLESFSYFQMVCPLLALLSGTQEKYDSNIDVITDAAKHIDSQSTLIFGAIDERKKIEVMSDSDFESWMITTSQHKVKLMKLLTKFVKEWNP
jgi:hypothetical protein